MPGIAGFGEACRLAGEYVADGERVCRLRDRLEETLVREAGARCVGNRSLRLPNTAGVVFPGVDGRALVMCLSRRGLAVSAGSACRARDAGDSPVLRAVGMRSNEAMGFVRISLGRLTTEEEIEWSGAVIADEVRRLRGARRTARGRLVGTRARSGDAPPKRRRKP